MGGLSAAIGPDIQCPKAINDCTCAYSFPLYCHRFCWPLRWERSLRIEPADLIGAKQYCTLPGHSLFYGARSETSRSDYKCAIQDFDGAMEIYLQNGGRECNMASAIGIVDCLMGRAGALASLGNFVEAAREYSFAAVLCEILSQGETAVEIWGRLARCLTCRGSTFIAVRDYTGAVSDLDRAVEVYLRLQRVTRGAEPDRAMIADCMICRGNAFRKLGKLPAAIQDYDGAILQCEKLSWDELERAGLLLLTRAHLGRAVVLASQSYLIPALHDLDRARMWAMLYAHHGLCQLFGLACRNHIPAKCPGMCSKTPPFFLVANL